MAIQLYVPFKNKRISAKIDFINKTGEHFRNRIWIILTHGAGGDMNTSQLVALGKFLAKSDFVLFRFTCKSLNINYRTKVYAKVVKFVCKLYNPKKLFIGGRSMGARAAVMLKKKELTAPVYERILGIICLSYPLHKVNDTSNLRDKPLKQCKKPLFFLSGDQDEMCKKELLENVFLSLKSPYKIHWLEGVNHPAVVTTNFEDDACVEAFQALVLWCKNIANNA